jgi:hypothetical protein
MRSPRRSLRVRLRASSGDVDDTRLADASTAQRGSPAFSLRESGSFAMLLLFDLARLCKPANAVRSS